MERIGLLRKAGYESDSLLKSSPNILENFAYEDFKKPLPKMTSPLAQRTLRQQERRSHSPKFSDTIEKNLFMRNVINPSDSYRNRIPHRHNNHHQSKQLRRSLEEISKDIKEIEDFLTVTENILKQERERDKELYARERKRKTDSKKKSTAALTSNESTTNKENKSPPAKKASPAVRRSSKKPVSPTFKINSHNKSRKSSGGGNGSKSNSPKCSKLYFRNGKIGCTDSDPNTSDVECTHALVKHILKYENEKPLVSAESVQKVLNEKIEMEEIAVEKFDYKPKNENTSPPLDDDDDVDSCSHPIIDADDDEKDVQIHYHESPEVSNKEQLPQLPLSDELETIIVPLDNADQMNRFETRSLNETSGQQFVRDQVRHLVRRFTDRTNKVKSRLERPPTPSSNASPPTPPKPQPSDSSQKDNGDQQQKPSRSLASSANNLNRNVFHADNSSVRISSFICNSWCGRGDAKENGVLDPQGKLYISWLCIVSITFLYNAWVIPLRSAFPFQTPENTNTWLLMDFCADVIYMLDVIFFKHRVMYLFEGFWVKDKILTRKNYMRKLQFKLDLLSLTPLDLLYFKFGTKAVYFRFPRLFKIQSFWEVFKLLDRVISSPHFVRVAKTLTYMLYMIHLTACSYYAYSSIQGLGTNRWVFSGRGHPYVRCFAFATKTATSIGKNPKPEKEGEYVFMTAAWLMGVFVFALLIGQIRDIISTATRTKNEYRQLEDETLEYMRRLNLPSEVQRRVKMWFKFTWDQQRTLDESHILDALPINLKTDIAISVHIQTLSKVQLFADCEEALLRDLVLKLRAVTFLPGDFVCRKGEVGKEMYIIKLGQVQVMGGPNNDLVLATLSEGSVFGEISLLAMNGGDGNRRTADVRSKGFSNLFVLSKSDLNEVIVYYPNAQAILKRRARSLMQKNAAREKEEARQSALKADVVIGNPIVPESPPKMLRTVIQALPETSPAVLLLTRGSKRWRRIKSDEENETSKTDSHEVKQNDLCEGSTDNVKRSNSPDLLVSIQNELKNKNINLTDSEKALIISSSSNSSVNDECDITVHKEM